MFSIVKDGQTFFVAFHVRNGTIPLVKKALAAIPHSVRHLKTFKMVFILFGEDIKQLRIFSEKTIHEIVDFPVEDVLLCEKYADIIPVLHISDSFNTTGYKKNIFVFNTIDLLCHMQESHMRSLYNITWLHEYGWKNCAVGTKEKTDFNKIAFEILLAELDTALDLRMPVYTNFAGTILDKEAIRRAKRIAEILTHE